MMLREKVAALIKGDVADDIKTLHDFSRDTSIFERKPSLVVYPKNADDVAAVVKFVAQEKKKGQHISVTGRCAGTDMSGGPLTDSIVVSFTKYMNRMFDVGSDYAVAEPGMYYRDFEKQTLEKTGMLLPSYPASRELCALGGIVSNNSAGELTLRYGKTDRYVRELDVILSDGSKATIRPLSRNDLESKKEEQNFEGEVYRRMHELIQNNWQEIRAATPRVSKNSAGYALWNVYDRESDVFDLTKLITGSQGTLGLVTRMKLGLVTLRRHRSMLVIFLSDLAILPEVVRRILENDPESFESYDDHTFKLAIRLLPQLLAQMGLSRAIRLGFSFLPEVGLVLRGGIPKLVLMAEFSEDTQVKALHRALAAERALEGLAVEARIARNKKAAEKYWVVRREAFAILRKKLPGLTAAAFIDDFVVPPQTYPEFLPQLFALLDKEKFIYAVTGHIGNGNFHIFPLVDLSKPDVHGTILELAPKVYELVKKYHGSTTGEHNDGIIRTPFLSEMFSPKMLELFSQTKHIFDPHNVFNPGKKVVGTVADIEKYMVKTSV
ncbi:MAG: putative oxidoreductase [Parcubacteria group bacterium Gr01-1014_8]|nr:MAG: putative oxidoreductase [Parcubacteria group bacterium Gr01-1014_8]